MRRHIIRLAAVLTVSSLSTGLAWAHGGVAATSAAPSHSHGGGGGGHSGFSGGHGGFGGGHSAYHSGGLHGGSISGGNHDFGGGLSAGSLNGLTGHGHWTSSSLGLQSFGAGITQGGGMSAGNAFQGMPSHSFGNVYVPGHHSLTYVGSGNTMGAASPGRHSTSYFQHEIRAAADAGLAQRNHHVPLTQPAQQLGQQQVALSHRQVGQVGRTESSSGGQPAVRDTTSSTGSTAQAQQRGIGNGRHQPFFFGANSPFNTANDSNSSPSNTNFIFYPWFFWGGLGSWMGGSSAYSGYGYGGGYGANYSAPFNFTYRPVFASYTPGTARVVPTAAVAQVEDEADDDQLDNVQDFSGQGEIDFRQGKYKAAVQSWRHALVDDPKNGAIILLLSQALFAVGQYDEAAGATQAALAQLPEDKWGTVITHYKELYPNIGDYTTQLRALEKARDAKPDAPALHFLLGYHFGYLGYAKHAVRELDKVLAAAPDDKMAKKLRDQFAEKLSDADKAALEKSAKSDKPTAGPKPDATPDESSGTPAGDKDDSTKSDKKDGGKKDDKAAAPGTDA
jgi:Flp pilus assembly protein TadD